MRILFLGLLLFSVNSFSLDFNQYCSFTQGQQDCSNEFMSALNDAHLNDESIIFEAGEVYLLEYIDTANAALNDIKIIGISENNSKPVIKTDKFYLFNINGLYVNNIKFMGIHNEIGDPEQSNTLVLLGGKDKFNKVNNITVTNNEFVNSAEDLLVLWNSTNVNISNNTFRRSGLAMRIAPIIGDPNDLRPRGSGLLFHNITDGTISFNEFYEMKKFAIFFDGSDLLDSDINIFNNHIDMLNFEKPTKRYGLKGGAGIYIGNSTNSHNIRIQRNRILNYTMNGMRINGSKILVKNNYFNFHDECSTTDDTISGPLVGMAIKAHFLIDSEITGNCVQNTNAGIVLETWNNIENIKITKNTIYDANTSIYVNHKFDGIYSKVNILDNKFYGSIANGIAFFSNGLSKNNAIVGNTFANKGASITGPLISLRNQNNLYFDNNWINAEARSLRWNFLRLSNIQNSTFKRSTFKSINGSDKDFGGIYFEDNNSEGNLFKDLLFEKLTPGIHGDSTKNTFDNMIYK